MGDWEVDTTEELILKTLTEILEVLKVLQVSVTHNFMN